VVPDTPEVHRVLLLGDLMFDVAGEAGALDVDGEVAGRLGVAPGGQPFGVAAWLAEAGCRPTVIGALSSGPSGAAFLALAEPYRVEVAPQLVDGEQGVVLLLRHPDGRSSKVADAGVAERLDGSAIRPELVESADAIYVSGYAFGRPASRDAARSLCAAAAAAARPVFVDVASPLVLDDLEPADWGELLAEARPAGVFATGAEFEEILGGQPPAPLVVVKHGAGGATLIAGGAGTAYPAASADVLDASGCGDALAAGFIAAFCEHGDRHRAMEAAIAAAGRCAARIGTLPAT
jgi:sugar/nucleoside kinase (ribokinase family)